jgi:hypothetical protein
MVCNSAYYQHFKTGAWDEVSVCAEFAHTSANGKTS